MFLTRFSLLSSAKERTLHPYQVAEGDTLGNIAERFDVDVDIVKDINDLESDLIFPNDTIMLPDTSFNSIP